MQFTIQNLFWLTFVVAIASWVGTFPDAFGVWCIFGYLFAPMLVALAASFFQRIDAQVRQFAGRVLLLMLAGLVVFSSMSLVIVCFTIVFWAVQLEWMRPSPVPPVGASKT